MAVFLLLGLQSMAFAVEIPNLVPGDPAPPFVLQSLDQDLLRFGENSSSALKLPIVFHAFSNNSGFLEWLTDNPDSVEDLIHLSPDNTHYVFMFYTRFLQNRDSAENLKKKFRDVLDTYYAKMS